LFSCFVIQFLPFAFVFVPQGYVEMGERIKREGMFDSAPESKNWGVFEIA
jgi:hypothetical protein